MDLSMYVAQILGLMYLSVGAGMLLSGDYYRKNLSKMLKEPGMMYLGGLMALVVGFLLVKHHNIWEGWPILVTLIGWLALLKGLLLLAFPKAMIDFSEGMLKSKNMSMWSVVVLALGLVFGYFGFIA